jgi:hypothetical protein
MEKVKVVDAKVVLGAAKKARNAGPHGKVHHSDGSTQASPNKHKVTDGNG